MRSVALIVAMLGAAVSVTSCTARPRASFELEEPREAPKADGGGVATGTQGDRTVGSGSMPTLDGDRWRAEPRVCGCDPRDLAVHITKGPEPTTLVGGGRGYGPCPSSAASYCGSQEMYRVPTLAACATRFSTGACLDLAPPSGVFAETDGTRWDLTKASIASGPVGSEPSPVRGTFQATATRRGCADDEICLPIVVEGSFTVCASHQDFPCE